jgi:succinate dehydrogenase/fumarate reductase flavoprotein subunit
MTTSTRTIPTSVDVVVLGTGAAGFTAAIVAAEYGANVAVFEKADVVGGTTAWSGGQVWIPNNPHMRDVGVADSREKSITYIMSLSRGLLDQDLVEAYVDAGPEMVELLEAKTPVQFYAVDGMPDYHPEFPGGSPGGGRTLECPIFPFADLGDWQHRVTPSPYFADPRITMSETPLGKAVPQPPSKEELERRSQRDERGAGQALAGRLLRACLDRGIEPFTGCAATDLVVRDGAVRGVIVDTGQGSVTVEATRGVILASGGFEWNADMVRAFLRGPMTHPVSMETNTGDGLRMAQKVGASLSNMREAWWIPVGLVPESASNPMGRALINGQRTLPHSIMVNRRGRRFTNEAANYNAFGAAFHVEDVSRFEYANLPCWLIFDQNYVDTYGFRVAAGGGRGAVPDWLTRGDSLGELAEKLDIDGAELERTVARWNENCAGGSDPDFGRGDSAFDCWWGDPYRKGRRDATLGPLERGPYYAYEIHSGCLGTKGGPRVDVNGQVLDLDGAPIEGLYAAGNVMGSPFGMTYGGPGGTLGPAMVFGYLAARHATA